MRVRKKPIVVEAERVWTILLQVDAAYDSLPSWVKNAIMNGTLKCQERGIVVETANGSTFAKEGDYVVCGPDGDIYPVSRQAFPKTFDDAYTPLCPYCRCESAEAWRLKEWEIREGLECD